ncbi:MAG: ectoine/hydroxyectoine ABC transporter permease subunit EhuD, partial [Candidatus Sumerlaeia bacterium]|nr:ectoine/hydroxyectoine ABC transporter permease subunit EhuD [Candidatus Sumerlaeia bacterium]
MNFQWDWQFTFETVLPALLVGFRITVMATILGMILALVLGLLLAIGRRSPIKFVSYPIGFLIEFIRSTPLLVQLFFLYYVLPDYGISLSPLTIGILALGVHYSSYTAEVYRAGIEAVDRGQWEAAISLNLSPLQTWKRIIIPQSIPPVVPALGNYLIAM